MTIVNKGSAEDIANSIKHTIGDTDLPKNEVTAVIDDKLENIDTTTLTRPEFFQIISEVKQELTARINELEGKRLKNDDKEQQPTTVDDTVN